MVIIHTHTYAHARALREAMLQNVCNPPPTAAGSALSGIFALFFFQSCDTLNDFRPRLQLGERVAVVLVSKVKLCMTERERKKIISVQVIFERPSKGEFNLPHEIKKISPSPQNGVLVSDSACSRCF